MTDFFDYHCDSCGEPYCERVYVMNLALGYVDDAFCLTCLASNVGRTPAAMAAYCYRYVSARDCFHDPWKKFDPSGCPKGSDNPEHNQCHCVQEVA